MFAQRRPSQADGDWRQHHRQRRRRRACYDNSYRIVRVLAMATDGAPFAIIIVGRQVTSPVERSRAQAPVNMNARRKSVVVPSRVIRSHGISIPRFADIIVVALIEFRFSSVRETRSHFPVNRPNGGYRLTQLENYSGDNWRIYCVRPAYECRRISCVKIRDAISGGLSVLGALGPATLWGPLPLSNPRAEMRLRRATI